MNKIAIIGPWGSGKSFLTHIYLKAMGIKADYSGLASGRIICTYNYTQKEILSILLKQKYNAIVLDECGNGPDKIKNLFLNDKALNQREDSLLFGLFQEEPKWLEQVKDLYVVRLTKWIQL